TRTRVSAILWSSRCDRIRISVRGRLAQDSPSEEPQFDHGLRLFLFKTCEQAMADFEARAAMMVAYPANFKKSGELTERFFDVMSCRMGTLRDFRVSGISLDDMRSNVARRGF